MDNSTQGNCNTDNSTYGRYDIIIGRDLLADLGLNLKISNRVIEADDQPLNGSTETMVDPGTSEFKYLNTGKFTPEEFFINA